MATIKEIKYEIDSQKAFLSGLNQLADAVKVTLGPKGKLVLMQLPNNNVKPTKDGVSVARQIVLMDVFENMGAQLVKQVASRTNEIAGDGTTTATVLAQSLVQEGMEAIKHDVNPIDIKNDIDKGIKEVIEFLKTISKPITTQEEVEMVASIAANGEKEISQIVAEAVKSLGTRGIVSIEESKIRTTALEIVKGLQFSRGYRDAAFCTNMQRMLVELDNPYIFITDMKINALDPILKFAEKAAKEGRAILFIADEIEGESLTTFISNKFAGFKVACVVAPAHGSLRDDILEDIAVYTGGEVITEKKGEQFLKVNPKVMGSAKKVIVTKDSTTIIGGNGEAYCINARIEDIEQQMNREKDEEAKAILQERLAKMSEGIGVIKVGGSTDAEIKERKDRVEDSLNATKAAMEEGIVPGGGAALFWAAQMLTNKKGLDFDPTVLIPALNSPLLQIMKNSGLDSVEIIKHLEEIYTHGDNSYTYGYDVKTNRYGDMFELRVCDPLKVVRCALENAGSIAGIFISTGCMIGEKIIMDPSKGMASSMMVV